MTLMSPMSSPPGSRATSIPSMPDQAADLSAKRRARSWFAKPATANSSRPSRSGRIECWPTSRSPPAARTPGPGPMISCWPALGACTSMTMRLYADRKSLPLERTTVTLQSQQDPCGGLRRMRNQGRHARPDRPRDRHGGQSGRRAAPRNCWKSPTSARCIAP